MNYVEIKFEDLRNYHVSTEKAKNEGVLEFKKTFSVSDGVKQIKDLVSSKRVKYTEEDIYFNERHIANLNNHGTFN